MIIYFPFLTGQNAPQKSKPLKYDTPKPHTGVCSFAMHLANKCVYARVYAHVHYVSIFLKTVPSCIAKGVLV